MALEDLTGTKTIDAMVATNPLGADGKSFGDDHLRGVKNVILNTFSNLTGAVTATQAELNLLAGITNSIDAFDVGTKKVFYQAAAPTGWTQDVTNSNHMLRVVNTAGGGVGGTVSPIAMDHFHSTADHALTIAEMPAHNHPSAANISGIENRGSGGVPVADNGTVTGMTGGGGVHNHGNTGNTIIVPLHIDVIIASKD